MSRKPTGPPGPGREELVDDRVEKLRATLEGEVAALTSSEAWARMLAQASRFHDYSLGNLLLIAWQRPSENPLPTSAVIARISSFAPRLIRFQSKMPRSSDAGPG